MAGHKEELRARLIATFRIEADEHLEAIGKHLLALEQGVPEAELERRIETMFREMHTLKGAAGSVSLGNVEVLCQACELVLSRLTQRRLPLTDSALACLRDACLEIARLVAGEGQPVSLGELLADLRHLAGQAAPHGTAREPPPAAPNVAVASPDTIRIGTARLDRLTLQSEDLLVPKLSAEERVSEARSLVAELARCRKALARGTHEASTQPEPASMRDLELALRETESLAKRMAAGLERDARTVRATVDTLVEEMRQIRMMPASSILDLFPGMVRELARQTGKEVVCLVVGGEVEVDRKVLEAMKDPLIHLVRNAVDHGIEAPETRRSLGKAVPATISVTVQRSEGARVEIAVADDGRGIDVAQVRDAAVRCRLVTAEAVREMDESEILGLLYRSGLSTSPVVTDISGHGLGLAIVAERVERLDGQIAIGSRPSEGTRFSMNLPASIATFRGLLVRVKDRTFLFPIESVEAAIRVAPAERSSVAGCDFIRFGGAPVPSCGLGRTLGLGDDEGREGDSAAPHVVIAVGGQRAAFPVDEVLGDREVLLKPLRPPLMRVPNIAAVGLLGTGQLTLVLRPADLFRSLAVRRPAGEIRPVRRSGLRQPTVLVVDDSITTRTMEKNLFEAMGYRVRTATDGVDAWMVLATEDIDIVVSDVDMPRMNGFDLTARIRADKRLAGLPVVLVTALESREDKSQGIRVGANAYVLKSGLDRTNLQEIVERLL